MGHIQFELNCGYHSQVSFEDKCDIRSRSSLAKELAMKLRKLINIYRQIFLHTQKL